MVANTAEENTESEKRTRGLQKPAGEEPFPTRSDEWRCFIRS